MVSKQVATYLGLYVAESTLQNNPQFSQLLENLLNHTSALSPLGCDQNLYDRFKQVKREFEQEKKLYFEQLFLYEELQEICLDGKLLNSKQRNPDLNYKLLNHSLAVSESCQLLQDSEDSSNVFGLKKLEHWSFQMKENENNLSEMNQTLCLELQERLKAKLETLMSFYFPNFSPSEEEKFQLSRKEFVELVSQHKSQLEVEKKELEMETLKTWYSLWKYCQKLVRFWNLLGEVYKMRTYHFQHSEIFTNYLISKLDTMILKLKILEKEIFNETYSPKRVEALSRIQFYLKDQMERLTEKNEELNNQIHKYSTIRENNEHFNEIVQEYAQILKKTEEQIEMIKYMENLQSFNY